MKIEIYHASKYGNGAKIAEELKRVLEANGNQAGVRHISDASPKELPPADLYVFGSPTRAGMPRGSMQRFLKKATLAPGTKYALFATHADEVPDKKTGRMPTQEELDSRRKNIPTLDAILKGKGLVNVSDKVFSVSTETSWKGTLREGWEKSVEEFAAAILASS